VFTKFSNQDITIRTNQITNAYNEVINQHPLPPPWTDQIFEVPYTKTTKLEANESKFAENTVVGAGANPRRF
jgi:hypothetical protein